MSRDDEELNLAELTSEAEFAELKPDTLRRALWEGRMKGRLRGKAWYTTRKAARDFLALQDNPHRPGRKIRRQPAED